MERMKLDILNLVCRLSVKSTGITHVKVLQHGGCPLKVWEISTNISKTCMIDIWLQWKANRKSNGTNIDDFE